MDGLPTFQDLARISCSPPSLRRIIGYSLLEVKLDENSGLANAKVRAHDERHDTHNNAQNCETYWEVQHKYPKVPSSCRPQEDKADEQTEKVQCARVVERNIQSGLTLATPKVSPEQRLGNRQWSGAVRTRYITAFRF